MIAWQGFGRTPGSGTCYAVLVSRLTPERRLGLSAGRRAHRSAYASTDEPECLEVRRSGQAVHRIRNTRWPGVSVVMVVPRDDNLNWEGTFKKVLEGT